jgi:hypothetical protein
VALDILALENDAAAASASSSTGGIPIYYSDGSNGVGNNGGLPFAPMMTYQKYLTMQVRGFFCFFCIRAISFSGVF